MKRASILAVGNVKGGVGKTTLAVNLAIWQALRGKDVLLVDGDEQGTARAFTQLRADVLGAPGYTAVSLQGAEIRTQLRMLRTKYESVIVDVGGRDTASLRAALCPCWNTGLQTRRPLTSSLFFPSVFSDTLAISHLYLMPIAKNPVRKTKSKDKQAEKFILAASEGTPKVDADERFIQTPIRFPKELLERIDWAAKKRGLNRSSWLRYAATRELDKEEQ